MKVQNSIKICFFILYLFFDICRFFFISINFYCLLCGSPLRGRIFDE